MDIRAHAKINLGLEVLGRRSDGYHELMTIFQTVSLADDLSIDLAEEVIVECSDKSIPTEENLVRRAATTLQQVTGCSYGVNIRLKKNIPVSMGLGGGSSDAGSLLVGLNKLWELGLSILELEDIAKTLGSDVPFFIRGGTALGKGKGDSISPLRPIGQFWILLVCPDVQVKNKTSSVYSLIKPRLFSDGAMVLNMAELINKGKYEGDFLFNVFGEPAEEFFEGLSSMKEEMKQSVSTDVVLSGTGPALFTLVSQRELAVRMRDILVSKGLVTYLIATVGPSTCLDK